MDLPFLNAYLDSVGAPVFRKGCNFAAAGSTILPATASSVSPFSFGIQVAQFLRFKDRVQDLSKSMHSPVFWDIRKEMRQIYWKMSDQFSNCSQVGKLTSISQHRILSERLYTCLT